MTALRAVVHVHSDWSYDGTWALERLAAAFLRRRYRAVLMTEHDRDWDPARWEAYREACRAASSDRFLVVPGIEYSDAAMDVHVLVWGNLPFLGEGRETADLLAEVAERGGAAVLAHPARRDVWERFGPLWSRHLAGVEVWNRKYDGYAPSSVAWGLARREPQLARFVGLDFHTVRQFFPLAMSLDVAGPPTTQSVFAALAQRRASPRAFRLPAEAFGSGPGYAAAKLAEDWRRPAARAARRVEKRLRGLARR